MNRELVIRDRQRSKALNVSQLRQITRYALQKEIALRSYELGFYFVDAVEMAQLNENYLRHTGSTDVITFDYSNAAGLQMHGEIFICVAEAVKQARQFKTTWQSEIVRYVIHGLLHLSGYDDRVLAKRRAMKREEDRVLSRLASVFAFSAIARRRSRAGTLTSEAP